MHRLLLLIILTLTACTSQPKEAPTVSFYYWKTVFKLSAGEKQVLDDNQVSRLYVRYFDIALHEGKPVPLSPVSFESAPGKMNIVPVIYIRNDVMLQPALAIDSLVTKIITYIDQINKTAAITCTEIQVDCDWTLASRDSYFKFLKQLKAASNKTLSATLRLHQIKYFERTGIPAVDRGVLMYYNMGHIAADASNSIYDRDVASKYVSSLKHYPVALDVALPIFSWGVHIRNQTVIGLLNKTDEQSFANDTHFEMKAAPYFEVKENVIKLGHYFQKGDRVKIESVNAYDLEDMADDLHEQITKRPHEIIFYDLDDFNIKHYAQQKQFFKKISSTF